MFHDYIYTVSLKLRKKAAKFLHYCCLKIEENNKILFFFDRDIYLCLYGQLKNCLNSLEKSQMEQNRITALIGALRALVCVAAVTRHQKGFTQER